MDKCGRLSTSSAVGWININVEVDVKLKKTCHLSKIITYQYKIAKIQHSLTDVFTGMLAS